MKSLSNTIFLLVFLLLCATHTYSCSCASRSASKDFRTAKAVFVGEVIEVSKGYPATVKFKIEKQWKGIKKLEIITSWGFEGVGSCGGFLFKEGEKFLVYAYGKELSVFTACSRTKGFKQAENDLKKLNSFWFRFYARVFPF